MSLKRKRFYSLSISVGQCGEDGSGWWQWQTRRCKGKMEFKLERERETLESMRFLLYRKLYVNFDPFGFKFKSMNQNFLEFAG